MNTKIVLSAMALAVLAIGGPTLATTRMRSSTEYDATRSSTIQSVFSSCAGIEKSCPPTAASCTVDAIEVREAGVQAAFDKMSDAHRRALQNRAASLHDAMQQDRSTMADAADNAWNAYRRTKKNLLKTYKQDVENVWKQYQNTINDTCRKIGDAKAADKGDTDDERLDW